MLPVRDIRVPFSLLAWPIVTLPTGTNDGSVVLIVSEIFSRQHHEFSNADLFDRAESTFVQTKFDE